MLRVVSAISLETPGLEVIASAAARHDIGKLIGIKKYSTSGPNSETVLKSEERRAETVPAATGACVARKGGGGGGAGPRRAWPVAAGALVAAASLGGVYLYKKRSDEPRGVGAGEGDTESEGEERPYPPEGAQFPRHVDFLLVGGGTASFAALRALRAARPAATVLVVGAEPLPPYMRPPLSKEVWREPRLHRPPGPLSFTQWNGRRRPLLYEPLTFYTPVERLGGGGGGAGAARGWRVHRLHVARHEAEVRAPGREPVTVSYGACLVAPGLVARRLDALQAAREAGRALSVRDVRDVQALARLVDAPDTRHVLIVGGGFLATELAASLAHRLGAEGGGNGKVVTMMYRGAAPLERVLPPYLAAECARRLQAAGVRLEARAQVVRSRVDGGQVEVRVAGAEGGERPVRAQVVVECVGAEVEAALPAASGLEVAGGGVLVNAELQARADVWAAGDAVSWHDPALGRRHLEHHDHAVASGRRAGENMAAPAAQRPYDHQPMFWSDLGPDLGLEAIGVVDSSLATVGVFSAEDVTEESAGRAAGAGGAAPSPPAAPGPPARRYERGVVFYTREKRVVGILLWNLFNRMHVARQVLACGEFEDLFEVAKLFSLHEDE